MLLILAFSDKATAASVAEHQLGPAQLDCSASIPLSAYLGGLIAAEWRCKDSIDWAVQAGTVGFSWKKWLPYATGKFAVGYPPKHANDGANQHFAPAHWRVAGQVSYVFLPERAFTDLGKLADQSPLSTPALQQWSVLADADVSLTLHVRSDDMNSFFHSYSLKVWQTLPPQWRTLGALRDTRNADIQALIFQAHLHKNNWSGTIGAGRMAIALDKITLSFFYPKAELTYHLSGKSGEL